MVRRAAFVLFAIAACAPELGERESHVQSARVLAVRADPPEAAPGEDVTFTALVASPGGTLGASLAWAYCTAPKSIAENEIVSSACLGDDATVGAGDGASARAPVPSDACARFGPDVPPGGFRPRDPDATGGYYQPMRATFAGAPTFALERLACNLANAPSDIATDFGMRYKRNANPRLAPIGATLNGAALAFDAVPAGARVVLRAAWNDPEAYVTFDLASQTLVDRREAMRVAWFATDGTFDTDKTGRAEDDPATTSDNGWTAPSSGTVHVWIVLRDSRGGVDWASVDVIVR